MSILTIPKGYRDGDVLLEADLDNFKDAIEELLNVTKLTAENFNTRSITAAKLVASSVSTGVIEDLAITTAKIEDLAVTAAKIATGAVNEDQLEDSVVNTNKLGTGAVVTSKIADLEVTTAKIATSNITTDKLASSSITNDKIVDGSLGTAVRANETSVYESTTINYSYNNNTASFVSSIGTIGSVTIPASSTYSSSSDQRIILIQVTPTANSGRLGYKCTTAGVTTEIGFSLGLSVSFAGSQSETFSYYYPGASAAPIDRYLPDDTRFYLPGTMTRVVPMASGNFSSNITISLTVDLLYAYTYFEAVELKIQAVIL